MYLVHHGIKGQKWGVRRYQNEDGTLTEAGKARYDGKPDYEARASSAGRVFRNLLTGRSSFALVDKNGNKLGEASIGQHNIDANVARSKASRARFDAEYAKASGEEKAASKKEAKAKKLEDKAHRYDELDKERALYDKHTSTGKLILQNTLMTHWGGEYYRDLRAMGAGRGEAAVKAMFGGKFAVNARAKKRYASNGSD